MRKILERNDPLLRKQSELLASDEFTADWVWELVEEMIAIMKERKAVGIAAPQIGVSKRIIVFGTSYTKRKQPVVFIPDTVLINPNLKILSEEKELGYEGCLNGEGMMAEVPRFKEIEYSGFDRQGKLINKK